MLIYRARPALVTGAALVLLLAGCAGATGTSAGDASSQEPATTMPTVTASSASPSETPEAAPAACEDTITVSLDREIGSGRDGYFILTNEGAASCSVVGYLDPAALDSTGASVTTVEHSDLNNIEGVPVELAPGASAYSIFWDDTADTLDACDAPLDADAIAVTVPGASAAQRVATGPLPLCDGRGSILHLGPIDSEQRIASKGY
jgi:Protein of unknown function (DUF4232)